MAKQKVDPVAWLQETINVNALTPTQREGLNALFANEEFLGRIREGVMGRSEISRRFDELTEREQQLKESEEELDSWRNDLTVWSETRERDLTTRESALAQQKPNSAEDEVLRRASEGRLDSEGGTTMNGKYLTPEDVEKIVNARLNQFSMGVQTGFTGMVGLSKFLNKKASAHSREFPGEMFDPDEYEKFYVEGKYSDYNAAYDDFVKDKRAAKQESEFKQKLDEARREGAREAMSNSRIPEVTANSRVSPIMRNSALAANKSNDSAPKTEADKVARFTEIYEKAMGSGD